MPFTLPNPTSPTNGQSLDATPILANEVAIANAIASFDGSQIQNGTILSTAFAATANPNTLLAATTQPFISSGVVWTTVSGLAGTMSGGTIYYNGTPVTINSVASHTFTASDDTYIDVDKNGNVTYQGVSNGGSAPSLTANSIRVAKVVTSGSAITSIALTGVDSNNVPIYPVNPYGYNSWLTWTPTLGGITIGNGTVVANYASVGKTTICRVLITAGSTTTMPSSGDSTITFPFTSQTPGYNDAASVIGSCLFEHVSGPTYYRGDVAWASTTTAVLLINKVSSTDIVEKSLNTSNASASFATGDFVGMSFVFEAA